MYTNSLEMEMLLGSPQSFFVVNRNICDSWNSAESLHLSSPTDLFFTCSLLILSK